MNAPLGLDALAAAGTDAPVDSAALDALGPALAQLDRRIERELRRVRARYELTLDELRGLYVSDAQVDALLRAAPKAESEGSNRAAAAARGDPAEGTMPATEGDAADGTMPATEGDAADGTMRATEGDATDRTVLPGQGDATGRSMPPAEGGGTDCTMPPAEGDDLDAAPEADLVPDLSPWRVLADALALTPLEERLLLAVLAPDIDRRYEALYAYLNDDAGRRCATPDLMMRLHAHDAWERQAVRTAIAPSGRLCELGVVQCVGGARDTGRAQRALRVQPAVADWLLGLPYADERLRHVGQLHWPSEAPPLVMAQATRARVLALAQAMREHRPLAPMLCCAAPLAEAVAVARELFAAADRPALHLDLFALRSAAAPGEVADAACLMAAVFGVGLVLAPVSALADADGRPAEAACAALRRLATDATYVVLADGDRRACTAVLGDALAGDCQDLAVAELTVAERIGAWQAALDPLRAEPDVAALADRFALGPARIAQAVAAAAQAAQLAGEARPARERLFEAARAVSAGAAGGVVRTVSTAFDWDALVLPPPVRERLLDIVRAVELRPRVLEDWGFARRMAGARGVKAMFAGPSGTGKTMAAAIIARTLGLEMHRVELAAIVSKYIGETEKNLDRAFDAARSASAILFIDEADALFGKRSEVKDAHDRYANVETAYLLQKMEDHDGVVILATNLATHIDEAFSRRMHVVVEFPLPDVARRERLWRGMFPAEAPRAQDIDFGFLARQFAFAGGDIRNIVLDAAYAAAEEEAPISMAHLLRAVARQYAKRGKVPSAAEFREYQGLLARPAAP